MLYNFFCFTSLYPYNDCTSQNKSYPSDSHAYNKRSLERDARERWPWKRAMGNNNISVKNRNISKIYPTKISNELQNTKWHGPGVGPGFLGRAGGRLVSCIYLDRFLIYFTYIFAKLGRDARGPQKARVFVLMLPLEDPANDCTSQEKIHTPLLAKPTKTIRKLCENHTKSIRKPHENHAKATRKPYEKHTKTMRKPNENHAKSIRKPNENHTKSIRKP